MKTAPTYYQREITDRSVQMPYAALFLEQGLGKSKIEIDATCQLYTEGKIDGLIVASNKAVAENWYINELPKHSWNTVPMRIVLWGRSSHPEKDLMALLAPSKALRVLCINVEALRSAKVQALVSKLVASGRFKLVVDESTLVKNPTAIQARRVLSLAKKCAYTRILSGEPAPNGPVDLYHQYKVLNEQILRGYTKETFITAFCETKTTFFHGRRKVEALKDFTPFGKNQFEKIVGPYTFRLRKADVDSAQVKFPAIDNKIIPVAMSEEQRRLYNEVLTNVSTELRGILQSEGTVRADVIVSRLIRLHQITSGFVMLEDGTRYIFDQNPKLAALMELMEARQGKSTIIWCHYRHDVDTVTAALDGRRPGKVARIYGGISDGERITTLERFMKGEIDLVANPQSIGHGLTLTAADTALYYSNHYNYEYKVQSRDRIHRLGQESDTCYYRDLVMQDSIDEQIMAALTGKEGFCKSLFKSEWIQRVLGVPVEALTGEEPEDMPD